MFNFRNILITKMCKSVVNYFIYVLYFCVTTFSAEEDNTYIIKPNGTDIPYYVFHNEYVTWYEARERCAGAGAQLWTPWDEAEALAVRGGEESAFSLWAIWTGINDLDATGVFETLDGRHISADYQGWAYGQPVLDSGAQHCVQLWPDSTLFVTNCNYSRAFVCHYLRGRNGPAPAAPRPLPGDAIAPHDKLQWGASRTFTIQQNTYVYHKEWASWRQAGERCARAGAALLVPEGEGEAAAVWGEVDWSIWTSINDLNKSGDYRTLDGRSITEVHNKWYKYQPDSRNGTRHCAMLDFKASLYVYVCENTRPYVCKYPAGRSSLAPGAPTPPGEATTPRLGDGTTPPRDETTTPKPYDPKEQSDETFTINVAYVYHGERVTWHEARERCAGAGARLWTPRDEAEARAVGGAVRHARPLWWIWTGINDMDTRGSYQTVDGRRPLNEGDLKWDAGQPNPRGAAWRCVLLLQHDFSLYVAHCEGSAPYVCAFPARGERHDPAVEAQPTDDNELCASYSYKEEIENSQRLGYEKSELINKLYYKLHIVPATWNDAHSRCIQEGAQLASPINGEFLKEMIRLMKTNNKADRVLTGIHDKFTPGQFSSIEGIPLRKIVVPWAERRPYSGVNDIIVLRWNEKLDLVSRNDAHLFICYKNISKITTTDNSLCNTGYVKDYRTGVYYKIHKERRTWSEAAAVCAAREGAHLAVITERMEAAALLGRLLSAASEAAAALSAADLFLVGISDWGAPNGWLTVHGRAVPDFGKPAWRLQKPKNSQEKALCGGLLRSGTTVAVSCNKRYSFICQLAND